MLIQPFLLALPTEVVPRRRKALPEPAGNERI